MFSEFKVTEIYYLSNDFYKNLVLKQKIYEWKQAL